MFPDVWDAGRRFWGPVFPDPGPLIELVTGIGPAGVATFVLDLDASMDVTFAWETDVIKSYDGQERRAAILDFATRSFKGSALLIGSSSVRTLRSQLSRHAVFGQAFLLGLPFEAITLSADSVGTSVFVPSVALQSADWANPGQRVVVMGINRTAINAVIQKVDGWFTLDVAPGAIGKAGAMIMPTVPIYLDPQQSFARYRNPEGFERWALTAQAMVFGFQAAGLYASISFEDAAIAGGGGSGALTDTFARAKINGTAGNLYTVSFVADGVSPNETLVKVGSNIQLHFHAGVTTLAKVVSLFATSADLEFYGNPNLAAVLTVNDTFTNKPLTGGTETSFGIDGKGASVVTYANRPVFDRRIIVEDTAADSLQAMNEIIDLGGVPANIGQTTSADWGRHVAMHGKQGGEWQWLKMFLATIRGGQRAFWLPTWRSDLAAVSSGVGTLTIEGPADEDGAFFSWYPTRRDIQVAQADGTITRATISNAVDNGNGTITLTTGVTLSASPIAMVSWLELCRLESDAISVTFEGHLFAMQTTARVVTR